MKPFTVLPILVAAMVLPYAAWSATGSPFAGRWDITVTPEAGAQNTTKNSQAAVPYPDWMEVVEREGGATVRIQPRSGGAREIKDFKLSGSHLSLDLTPPDGKGPASSWELDVKGDKLTGVQKRADASAGRVA